MDLSPSALAPWIEAFLSADRDATRDDAPELRAAYCSAEVAEGFAELPTPEAPIELRTLFRVLRYDHPQKGPFVAAEVSEATAQRRGQGKYHLLLIIQDHLGHPRVTGVYDICTACVALGVDAQGDQCVECGGLGWEHWFGLELGPSFGAPGPLERINRPSTPLYLPVWKRDS